MWYLKVASISIFIPRYKIDTLWKEVLMSSFDEVQEIVKMLKSENLSEYATQIDDTLRGGSTGSEIWGGVRFYLLRLPPSLVSTPLKVTIEALIKEIDKSLPR